MKQYKLSLSSEQELKLQEYMNEKGIKNTSETLRELVDFALTIKAHTQDESVRGNRELLEKILYFTTVSMRASNHALVEVNSFPEPLSVEKKNAGLQRINQIDLKSKDYVDKFLTKEID